MKRSWFYFKNGKAYGPYTWKKILELLKSEEISEHTKVWANGFSERVYLAHVIKKKHKSIKPPPLPTDTDKLTDDLERETESTPPPLPIDQKNDVVDKISSSNPPHLPFDIKYEFTERESQSKKVTVGPLQSKEDIIAANTITKVSFGVFSLLLMASLYSFFIYDPITNDPPTERWPSVFSEKISNNNYEPYIEILNESTLNDIYYTQGFKIGQDHGIEVLSFLYPDISNDLYIAKRNFDLKFEDAFRNIDQTLSSEFPSWPTQKEELVKSVSQNLNFTDFSKQEAEEFLKLIQNRGNGHVQSPVLETLLMFHPKYIKAPQLLFSDEFTQEYRSNNSPKAKGVDLAIEYPTNWEAEEGRRPNIVQKFTSKNGDGLVTVNILIKDLPEEIAAELSEDDIYFLNDDDIWAETFNGTTRIDKGNAILAKQPSIWGEFAGTTKQVGVELDVHGLAFMMIKDKKMIQLLFMASPTNDNSKVEVKSLFNHYAPVFHMMLISLDFYDRYN
ncbi:DUF4339 domain-containing protein [Rhodohalobacter sulfatireducens]|uniref:DUF4339 domain-containing protein n=1 Tax=Rhodohalobacter sulfatireducens TaxID=2911366 RepID=A0ABS9KAC1_9BACT|nr:DUF4339 domain-containing protein [Rhodohalobacter sulfatireducens]MCG2587780.1 DUF4339 domain-containing protein [Rhodohalobacter sulfatireducens]